MTEADLRSWLRVADEAARRGADVLERWRAKFSVREKARADLVTEADFASQQEIRSFLLAAFPDHAFLGEEDAAAKEFAPPPTPRRRGSSIRSTAPSTTSTTCRPIASPSA